MSYEEFRKRIDTARQILVGAVPSPAGQIDQITYALMYKFMNDIDDQSAALGGKRTYFAGDYAKYNWHELMKPGLEAHEQLELYRQAIQGMSKNPGLPPLFREIYQNAFLPFNSPSVLRLFLEEINKFNHGDSDDIGDAYEYLLSITGAQGDVGQFRTPRHIIKFIVDAVNPTKENTVLDPAVGTAGFLIAAYNHVKSQHDGKDDQGNVNDEEQLTADEREKLHHNYRGFDIDPTMVRTASVNLYLHGFTSPDIRNHDSLSSEDYWNDRYDIVLANPPFMTPKGGIQPHKKFSISANRAEVLFVDYIASHLKPNGRAGVIVPEGIIFQSGKAYKELRKNLVENYLYAVVSLPAGVFQPYSGVKTSVLLMDKQLAKERDDILFVKVESDGYTLGAQRRRDVLNDQLPQALDSIKLYQENYHQNTPHSHTVSRKEIAESGDYNLSGDRYKIHTPSSSSWERVKLTQIAEINRSTADPEEAFGSSSFAYIDVASVENGATGKVNMRNMIPSKSAPSRARRVIQVGDTLISTVRPNLKATAYIKSLPEKVLASTGFAVLTPSDSVIPQYLYYVVSSDQYVGQLISRMGKGAYPSINTNDLSQTEIPLPPIDIQREIATELNSYQEIISLAREMSQVKGMNIVVNPSWERFEVGELAELEYGYTATAKDEGDARFIRITDIDDMGSIRANGKKYVDLTKEAGKYILKDNDIIVARTGATFGKTALFQSTQPSIFASFLIRINFDETKILPEYYWAYAQCQDYWLQARQLVQGGAQPQFNGNVLKKVKVPLPSLEEQKKLANEYKKMRNQLVTQNLQLAAHFEQKIKDRLAEVWGA